MLTDVKEKKVLIIKNILSFQMVLEGFACLLGFESKKGSSKFLISGNCYWYSFLNVEKWVSKS